MSWIDEAAGLLQKYSGASPSSPPPDAAADFNKVAERAPSTEVAGGLAEAFRSGNTPPFGEMISQLFAQSDGSQRAGILNHLLAAAGPAASSAGVLGSLQAMLQGARPTVTPEQAQQVPPDTVRQLAEAAQKSDPSVIDRAGEFYAQHPILVKTLGAGALALIMSHISQRR